MPSTEELYQIADELRATANLGLRFSKDEYDLDRYNKVLSASARLIGAIEDRSSEEVLKEFEDNTSRFCPRIGAGAAVFKDEKILLIKRHDTGLWAYPGGLVEVGETLAEATERELWEETRIRGQATRLIGIFDSRKWKSQVKAHMYHALFLVESADPSPEVTSEATEVGFFSEEDLPPLAPGHHLRVPFVLELLREGKPLPFFDVTGESKYPQ